VPALVLLKPNDDGELHGELYRGSLQAEQVYEWLKRSFATSLHAIKDVRGAESAVQAFLAPPWGRAAAPEKQRASRVFHQGFARQPAKAIIFSSRPVADTLFARYIAGRYGKWLELGAMHVSGGLQGNSLAAEVARSLGITELPMIAIWPDGPDCPKPTLIAVDVSSEVGQREEILSTIGKAATPSVPLLTAANLHTMCAPGPWDEESSFCVLLFVTSAASWSDDAVRLLQLLRTVSMSVAPYVRFAWVDVKRQQAFSHHLAGLSLSARGHDTNRPAPPVLVALKGNGASSGLRHLHTAQQPHPVQELTAESLTLWLSQLRDGKLRWQKARGALPPLLAEKPPRLTTTMYVWFVHSGGWMWLLVVVAALAAAAYYGPALLKKAMEQPPVSPPPPKPPQERPGQHPEQQRPEQRPRQAEPSSSSNVPVINEHNAEELLDSSVYVLVFVVNSGVADRDTMRALINHFQEMLQTDSCEYRQWSLATLDMSLAMALENKPAILGKLVGRLRQCPFAVVRRLRSLVAYRGQAAPRPAEEWIARLKMGELSWESLG